MDEHVYDVIDVSGGTNPSLTDGIDKIPLSQSPLPAIPPIVAQVTGGVVGVAKEGNEEAVYATIQEDQ